MKYRLLGTHRGVRLGDLARRDDLRRQRAPALGHPGWAGAAEVERMVDTALDAGVNFVDTADGYSDGESEELLGKALGKRRRRRGAGHEGALAGPAPGPNDVGTSRLHIMQNLEDSLRRLGTDHIDLYQIHNFDQITPMEEMLRGARRRGPAGQGPLHRRRQLRRLADLQGAGHLRRARSWPGSSRCRSTTRCWAATSSATWCRWRSDEGIGLTVWSPLAGGFLSGKVGRDGAVADSGAPSAQPGYASFTPFDPEHAFGVVDVLKGVAARHEVSPARVAVAWLLARPRGDQRDRRRPQARAVGRQHRRLGSHADRAGPRRAGRGHQAAGRVPELDPGRVLRRAALPQ